MQKKNNADKLGILQKLLKEVVKKYLELCKRKEFRKSHLVIQQNYTRKPL